MDKFWDHTKSDYLSWYKRWLQELDHIPETCSLLNSSSAEWQHKIHQVLKSEFQSILKMLNIPNPWGHPHLIQNLIDHYGLQDKGIVLTSGATNGIYAVCRTLLRPGLGVAVESPAYEPLVKVPFLCGADVNQFQRSSTGEIQMQSLENALNPKTTLIIITNLHNPSSGFLNDEQLLEIAQRARAINPRILILVDEIYKDFVPGMHTPAACLGNEFISVNSLTKVYGVDYLRCGWVVASMEIAEKISETQVWINGIGSRFLEAASAVLIKHLSNIRKHAISHLNENRKILTEAMTPLLDAERIKGEISPYGCVYFPKITRYRDTWEMTHKLIDEKRVFVVPGRFFGAPDHIRIGYGGNRKTLTEGLTRLVDILKS